MYPVKHLGQQIERTSFGSKARYETIVRMSCGISKKYSADVACDVFAYRAPIFIAVMIMRFKIFRSSVAVFRLRPLQSQSHADT